MGYREVLKLIPRVITTYIPDEGWTRTYLTPEEVEKEIQREVRMRFMKSVEGNIPVCQRESGEYMASAIVMTHLELATLLEKFSQLHGCDGVDAINILRHHWV